MRRELLIAGRLGSDPWQATSYTRRMALVLAQHNVRRKAGYFSSSVSIRDINCFIFLKLVYSSVIIITKIHGKKSLFHG
jgi:hypothetical protein